MNTDALSVLRSLYERAGTDIAESEETIRKASKLRDQVKPILEDPSSDYLSKMYLTGVVLPGGSNEFEPQATVASEAGNGYFQEMKALLPALRSAKGHLPRLHLLASACGGKLDLYDVGEFLLSEKFSDAKDIDSLLKNLGTAINKDPDFAPDPQVRRVYYFLPVRQPPTQPERVDGQKEVEGDAGSPSLDAQSDEQDSGI